MRCIRVPDLPHDPGPFPAGGRRGRAGRAAKARARRGERRTRRRAAAPLDLVRLNSATQRTGGKRQAGDRAVTSCASRTAGLFVPKPSRDADCQRWGTPDLGTTVHRVRWRPLLAVAIVIHLVTRLASQPGIYDPSTGDGAPTRLLRLGPARGAPGPSHYGDGRPTHCVDMGVPLLRRLREDVRQGARSASQVASLSPVQTPLGEFATAVEYAQVLVRRSRRSPDVDTSAHNGIQARKPRSTPRKISTTTTACLIGT